MPPKKVTAKEQLTLWRESYIKSDRDLLAVALALGARSVEGWSDAEGRLVRDVHEVPSAIVERARREIADGADPLGDTFCLLRTPAERRDTGATYTPSLIVEAMCSWAQSHGRPSRVIDAGSGSARFMLEAGRRFPGVQLIGVENDPFAAVVARGNLASAGLARRACVKVVDYRKFELPEVDGRTLFIGNPPYVRHHQIDAHWKQWLTREASARGLNASQLAGLYVYFMLATVMKAKPGDYGAFVTAAEWLDVNYGSLVREMFLGALGGQSVVVVEPKAMPFPDAQTTAAITFFEVGSRPASIRLKRVERLKNLSPLQGGKPVRRERLETERRWSHLTRGARPELEGYVELGDLCRVHRGQVTGANKIWIEGPHSEGLPESVLFRTVTKARELINSGPVLIDLDRLRRVIDLPPDLDVFDRCERRAVEKFLRKARRLGAADTYVARNRRAWWSVGLYAPAPILATYMARRPPAFVRNLAEARHINIAHGIYPRVEMSEAALSSLVAHLSTLARLDDGRTYAGGLTKFEPREMERILVPGPELLTTEAA